METESFAKNWEVIQAKTAYDKGVISSSEFAGILIQVCLKLSAKGEAKNWVNYIWNLYRETEAREFKDAYHLLAKKLL